MAHCSGTRVAAKTGTAESEKGSASTSHSILFINQYYYPDCSATSQILQQLAEDLAQQGFQVSVLTGNSRNGGGKLTKLSRESHRDISIIRVPSTRFGKRTLIGQALNYLSFHFLVALYIILLPGYEVVVAMTTPPLIAWAGCFARFLRNSRFVYWVHDLYPDVAAALGTLPRKSWLFGICSSLSRFALRSADRVITVGEMMAEKAALAGAELDRVRVVHNWADRMPALSGGNSFSREHALENKNVVLYAGNFGRAHLFDELIAAAIQLKGYPRIEFILVGSGNQEARLRSAIAKHRLTRVRLLPPVPFDRLVEVLESATVGIVTQKPETAGLLVPSKLYGIMAAARPILFVGPESCEAARIIRDADCGYVVKPGDSAAVARAILEMGSDTDKAERMGQSGRVWFETHYVRSLAVRRFVNLLIEILRPSFSEGMSSRPDTANRDRRRSGSARVEREPA